MKCSDFRTKGSDGAPEEKLSSFLLRWWRDAPSRTGQFTSVHHTNTSTTKGSEILRLPNRNEKGADPPQPWGFTAWKLHSGDQEFYTILRETSQFRQRLPVPRMRAASTRTDERSVGLRHPHSFGDLANLLASE